MIIDDDAFRIGEKGAVAVLAVADVAVIVGDNGAVLAAALVFAAARVIVGETPEIGISVLAHSFAGDVGFAAVTFVNNINGFADIAFHAGIEAGAGGGQANQAGQKRSADKGNGHGVLSSGKTKCGIIKKENKSGKVSANQISVAGCLHISGADNLNVSSLHPSCRLLSDSSNARL